MAKLVECMICGAGFLPRADAKALNKYCSNSCKGTAQVKRKEMVCDEIKFDVDLLVQHAFLNP